MQMAVIELVRKEAKTEGGNRVSLIIGIGYSLMMTCLGQMDKMYL